MFWLRIGKQLTLIWHSRKTPMTPLDLELERIIVNFGRCWFTSAGRRAGRGELVEDGLQSADPRRQWVAVVCDRAFQISYEGELFFVGKAWRRASAPSPAAVWPSSASPSPTDGCSSALGRASSCSSTAPRRTAAPSLTLIGEEEEPARRSGERHCSG